METILKHLRPIGTPHALMYKSKAMARSMKTFYNLIKNTYLCNIAIVVFNNF